jgi:hypothetical protein
VMGESILFLSTGKIPFAIHKPIGEAWPVLFLSDGMAKVCLPSIVSKNYICGIKQLFILAIILIGTGKQLCATVRMPEFFYQQYGIGNDLPTCTAKDNL